MSLKLAAFGSCHTHCLCRAVTLSRKDRLLLPSIVKDVSIFIEFLLEVRFNVVVKDIDCAKREIKSLKQGLVINIPVFVAPEPVHLVCRNCCRQLACQCPYQLAINVFDSFSCLLIRFGCHKGHNLLRNRCRFFIHLHQVFTRYSIVGIAL